MIKNGVEQGRLEVNKDIVEYSKKAINNKIISDNYKEKKMNKREKKEYIISNYNGEQLQEYVDKLKKIDDTFTYASIRYFLIKGKEEGRIKEIIKGNKNSKKTQMIIDYYKENYPQKNFREIGEYFGLSKQRINQIIKKAKEQQITHG